MKRNIKNNNGFTIIEVLIVLAIAGLIMAVVLLAVPGLQRSQANEAARTDASHIATAVSNWSDNNGAAVPTTASNVTTIYGDSGNLAKFTTIAASPAIITTITNVTVPSSGWYLASGVTAVGGVTGNSNWSVVIDTGVTCSAATGTTTTYGPTLSLVAGTSTQAVVLYTTQTSGAPNWNCLQAE